MGIAIGAHGVRQAGDDLQALAADATLTLTGLFDGCDAAAAGNPGWASAGALTVCAHAWRDQLTATVAGLLDAGVDIDATAADLSGGDEEAAGRIGTVLTDLADG